MEDTPVFIVSPMQRCGTNFLAHVLRLHPSFQLPDRIWEDYLLHNADLLDEYVVKTTLRWRSELGDVRDVRETLLAELGQGILSFLDNRTRAGSRLLCKTPASFNLYLFPKLFPAAKLLIMIRDGRDVVESAVRTWPDRLFAFERSARRWVKGVRSILRYTQGDGSAFEGRTWTFVRYEDLIRHPRETSQKLFTFLEIDPVSVDLEQIVQLPLRGSSVHTGDRGEVHWDPVKKPEDFNPIGRWHSWGPWRRAAFAIIAQRELNSLGYAE